jgi:hypothetical protein
MIHLELFAVRVRPASTSTPVVWLCGKHYAIITPTFEAFWERYLLNRDEVLHPRIEPIRPAGWLARLRQWFVDDHRS